MLGLPPLVLQQLLIFAAVFVASASTATTTAAPSTDPQNWRLAVATAASLHIYGSTTRGTSLVPGTAAH
jgi:hypothetical protein